MGEMICVLKYKMLERVGALGAYSIVLCGVICQCVLKYKMFGEGGVIGCIQQYIGWGDTCIEIQNVPRGWSRWVG